MLGTKAVQGGDVFRQTLCGEVVGGKHEPVPRGVVVADGTVGTAGGHAAANHRHAIVTAIAEARPGRVEVGLFFGAADPFLEKKANRDAAGAAGAHGEALGDIARDYLIPMPNQLVFGKQRIVAQLLQGFELHRIHTTIREALRVERRGGCCDQGITQRGDLIAAGRLRIPGLNLASLVLKSRGGRAVAQRCRNGPIDPSRQRFHRLRCRLVEPQQRIERVFEGHDYDRFRIRNAATAAP